MPTGDPDEQYYSYWVLVDFLVPNTHSKIEEHTTAEQGVSVFSPLDYDDETVVAGEKDEEKGEGDGGGLVPLSPWTGGRGGDDDRHVLLSPGTDTAWVWGVPPNAPPGTTEKTWYAREGQEFIEKKDDADAKSSTTPRTRASSCPRTSTASWRWATSTATASTTWST